MHAKRHPIRMEYGAGCDADGRLTALRVRAVGDSGAYASVGMKVLERMAGHASGPYHVPAIDVEAVAVRTNNPVCGAFRGLRRQPGPVRHGGRARPAGRAGRHQRLGDPQAQRDPARRWCGGRARSWTTAASAPSAASTRSSPPTTPRWRPARPSGSASGLKNSGLGNGFKEIAKAVVRFRSDGIVEVRHCWTEMGQGVHTVALQVAVEELALDPDRIEVIVDTTRELGPGQTTGSRGHAHGRRRGEGGLRGGAGRRLPARASTTRASTGSTGRTTSARCEHPIIHSTFGYAAQLVVMDRDTRRHRAGGRRPRRRPGREPAAVRGPDRGQRAHGPRLRADRGLPGRPGDRLPHQHDAAQPRHPAGQGRAADRRHPGRVAAAELAVRHQGRRRDRPGARRPAPSPPPCTTSTASGAPPCRCPAPAPPMPDRPTASRVG